MRPTIKPIKPVQKITPINTIEYVVSSRMPESMRIVVKYGLPPATSPNDLFAKINYLVKKFPTEVMKDIAEIHPDKDLILKTLGTETVAEKHISKHEGKPAPEPAKAEEKKASACGCSGADGVSNCCGGADGKTSGCDGNAECKCGGKGKSNFSTFSTFSTEKSSSADGAKNYTPILLVGAFVAGALLLMYGNKIKLTA